MPRSPKDNQEIRDARREQILTAAARVFAEKGYARTKISDIAAAAGLSHGLVYHYFDSKHDMFAAIVDEMAARIRAELDADEDKPAIERLVAGFNRACVCCREPVDATRMMSQAIMQGGVPELVHQRLAAHVRGVYERLADRIAEAQRDGDLDPSLDSGELASALICLTRGMTIRLPGAGSLPFDSPGPTTLLRMLGAREQLITALRARDLDSTKDRTSDFDSPGNDSPSEQSRPVGLDARPRTKKKRAPTRSSQKETP